MEKAIIDQESIPPGSTADIAAVNAGVDVLDQSIPDGIYKRLKFTRLDDRKPGASWILMIYGPSKSGKTFTIGSCGSRTLLLNTGDGIETLMSPLFRSMYPASKDMIIIDLREHENKASAFDDCCNAIDFALANFTSEFDWIVLDEATAFRKYAMNKSMELNTEARTKTTRDSRIEEFVKPEVGDYGLEMQMVEWFLGTYIPIFKKHNKHFVMLAHERQVFTKPAKIGDEPNLKKIQPGFTGKTFPDAVPAYFDDVFHMEVVGGGTNTVHRLRTIGSESEVGGTRHGGVFQGVETNPNLSEMLKRIQSGKLISKR